MTRTSPSRFDVPDLHVPELSEQAAPAAPASSTPAAGGVRYEHTYLDDPALDHEASSPSFELDGAPRELPDHYVSGLAATSLPLSLPSRFSMPVSDFAPQPEALRVDPPFAPPAALDVAVDAIRTLPMDLWKRVPAYAFLALVLGNGCKCGGLSMGTNVVLTLLLVIGLVGVAGSLSQRSP